MTVHWDLTKAADPALKSTCTMPNRGALYVYGVLPLTAYDNMTPEASSTAGLLTPLPQDDIP